MDRFPMDPALWQRGLTLDEFAAKMKTHQADMRRRLREVTLPAEDFNAFARIEAPIHALVMTEDWCGDSLMNLPILARLVEAAPGMDLRIFIRSQSRDLNDYYTAHGITHIPVFTFLDGDFSEIGTWVERPEAAHARVGEWMAAYPEVAALLHDSGMTTAERHQVLSEKFDHMLSEMEGWYLGGLQQATLDELKAILAPEAKALPV